jgi:hypothetical protein
MVVCLGFTALAPHPRDAKRRALVPSLSESSYLTLLLYIKYNYQHCNNSRNKEVISA